MIYFFHHYELPVILQQAQIRDILNRTNGQVHINFNNVTMNNNNNNNNNANVANNNVVRRIIRPRFTLGRFQFRFVFQALHNPPPNANTATDAPVNNTTTTNAQSSDSSNAAATANTQEVVPSNETTRNTLSETTGAAVGSVANTTDTVDTAALQRYAAEIVESTREVEQLDREGRLELSSTENFTDPPFDRQEEEDCSSQSEVVEDTTTHTSTSTQLDSETCDVPSLIIPNPEGHQQNHSDNHYLSSSSVNVNSGDNEAHDGSKDEAAVNDKDTNITNTDTEGSSTTAASLQNDLLEIRSDLAEAAREASELLRDIHHHN